MKIMRLISGGQSGVDRAGLDAAIAKDVEHGGLCPKGRKAEDGPIDAKYNLTETISSSYLPRTEKNVENSDVTFIFVYGNATGGSARTVGFCIEHNKPYIVINLDVPEPLSSFSDRLADYIEDMDENLIINIAGSRESKAPGIYEITRKILETLIEDVDHNYA